VVQGAAARLDTLIGHMQTGCDRRLDSHAARERADADRDVAAVGTRHAPATAFREFRGYLGSASGGQSHQFRALEAVSGLRDEHFMHVLREHGPLAPAVEHALSRPTLQDLFKGLLRKHETTLEAVYLTPAGTPLFLLAESLIEYEQGFGLWRFLHVQLVERIIGPQTGGTGGTLGAKYLQRTLSQRFFPDLWEVRSRVFGAGPVAER
jgi:tryptophan 2,3-dioxygenase